MTARPFNLAIETTSRQGSITLGRDDEMLQTCQLAQRRRHNVELVPTLDRLFRAHHAKPNMLGQLYVSIGPGSFTGLRIAVSTAKMFGLTLNVPIVAVPTIEVVLANTPTRPHVAVCLSTKREQMYCGVYRRVNETWQTIRVPELLTPEKLCELAPRPLAVLGDKLPPHSWPEEFDLLDTVLAVPSSESVWRLGRDATKQNRFTDPLKLQPLYARRPEAEELWQRKMKDAATR